MEHDHDVSTRFERKPVTGLLICSVTFIDVVDMDMDPRPGYDVSSWETGFSDFRLVPDLRTLRTVPWLPATAIVICDAYHEMEQPVSLLRNMAARLKPAGLIGIVDFTKDGGGPGPEMDDRVDPDTVIRDVQAAGLVLRSRETFLKYQYMLVFEKPRS